MITSVNFISISVKDQDRALAFYKDKLGFSVKFDSPMGPNQRWLQLSLPLKGGTDVVLWNGEGSEPGGFLNASFTVTNIHEFYQEMKQKEVDITEIETQDWGKFSIVKDPDGNKILFLEPNVINQYKPDDNSSVIIDLGFKGEAKQAYDLYQKVFDALPLVPPIMEGNNRVAHAALNIRGSSIFFFDEMEGDSKFVTPATGRPQYILIYTPDFEETLQRAKDNHFVEEKPTQYMFWGDNLATFVDPFGIHWNIAKTIAKPTPEEFQKGMEDFKKKLQEN